MKKLILVTDGVNRPAGTERAAVNLVNLLANHYEVVLVTPDDTQSFYAIDKRVRRAGLNTGSMPHGSLKLKWLLAFKKNLQSFIESENPNVIVGTVYYINCVLCLLKAPAKKILCEHISYYYHGKFRRIIRKKLYRGEDKRVVVLTEIDANIYRSSNISAYCIPNFVNEVATANALPHVRPQGRILAVGRLTHQKGFDMLIPAFDATGLWEKGWKLLIIGDGTEREKLCNEIASRNLTKSIEILPPLKNLSEVYASSTFYVLSSRHEAMPMVLLEAIASGLPIVAFDCVTGPRQIMQLGNDDYAGILVPPEDVNGLAAAILGMASSVERQNISSRKGLEAAQRFSKEAIEKNWIELIEA